MIFPCSNIMPRKYKPSRTTGGDKVKRGPLSKDERYYIEKFWQTKSVNELVDYLRRPLKTVKNYVDKLRSRMEASGGISSPFVETAHDLELMKQPEWQQLEIQLSPDEFAYFKYKYFQLTNQFGIDDITPTENMQIFELIKTDIMGQRATMDHKVCTDQILLVSKHLEKVRKADTIRSTPETRGQIDHFESKIEQARKASASIAKQINDNQVRMSAMLKELKATRDQRKKVIEDSGKSFIGLLKALHEEEFREREGMNAELYKLAARKESDRLSQPHQFADGVTDLPFLTPKSILKQAALEESYEETETAE